MIFIIVFPFAICLICFVISILFWHRYKMLLCTVDLTKDFFFSYSYHAMRSLQKNLYDYKTGQHLYKKKCVWNKFLTSEIRNRLGNTLWTVALVHGFFKQVYNRELFEVTDYKWVFRITNWNMNCLRSAKFTKTSCKSKSHKLMWLDVIR